MPPRLKNLASRLITLSATAGWPLIAAAGSISGHVYDVATRELLVGANVQVMNTPIGATTDVSGRFQILNLEPGSYRLQATYIGYAPEVRTDIVVASGRQTEIVFDLEASAVGVAEVTVKPSYFAESHTGTGSTQALSNEEIRRAPGGNEDIVRAVAVLPGVVQSSAGRNDLIVRGGAPSENLYRIDNLEVPNINHFGTQGATGGPLSFINLDFVRDVTFSTGGFGAQYGDKLSSVMAIDLKEGRSDRIGGKATISASQFGLNLEGPAGRNGSFVFSVRRSYLDFIFKSAGFGFVPEYWDFLGKAASQIGSRDQLSVLMIGTLDKVRFFNETLDQRYDNSRILGNSQDQYYTDISWQHLFRGGFLTTSLGRTYIRYDFNQSDTLLNPIFESSSTEGQTSFRSDGVLRLSSTTQLAFGAKVQPVLLDGNLFVSEQETDFGDSLPQRSLNWNRYASKGAAYVQISCAIGSRLDLQVGERADYFDMIHQKEIMAPRASLRFQATPSTAFTLSGGVYYQAPSYIWLTTNADNSALKYIRADQAVAGVEYLLRPDAQIRIEGYIKDYSNYPASLDRDYLVLSNTGAGYDGSEQGFASFGLDRLVSRGRGFSRGVELLIQKRLSEIRCYGIASLTIGKTEFKGLDGATRPGSFDQPVIFNLSGGYKPDNVWEFSAKFRVGSGTPYTPFRSDGTQDVPGFNAVRMPVFHSLDLRVDRYWNFRRWSLITYVDLQNVYNNRMATRYRWDERDRRVVADRTIGLLPTVGISAEF